MVAALPRLRAAMIPSSARVSKASEDAEFQFDPICEMIVKGKSS